MIKVKQISNKYNKCVACKGSKDLVAIEVKDLVYSEVTEFSSILVLCSNCQAKLVDLLNGYGTIRR
jgi:hypothetical protein